MSTGIPNIHGTTEPPSESHSENPPSQIHGHTKYAKGIINETIGQMANSSRWTSSGADAKAAGISEMRAAKENTDVGLRSEYATRDPAALHREGWREGALGKTVGCAGMEERGGEKVQVASRRMGKEE